MLNDRQLADYARDGFLVIENFASAEDCDRLMAHMNEMLKQFDPSGIRTVFSTDGEQAHARDLYFLESGDKVRFFFEAGAFDGNGNLTRDKTLCINKVGHALHDLDPEFEQFSRQPQLAALAKDIGMAEPLLLQSMYIFKQPHIGGEVTCHQDSSFIHTEPLSCTGFWIALEDATEENGCLLAEPGGHKRPLAARFRRQGDSTELETIAGAELPSDNLKPLPVPQGTLIVLHGSLPHRSNANLSPRSRHAYTLHLIDGACHYSEDNWLQRSADMPARGFH